MKTKKSYIRSIWDFVASLATAIVSGLPREKVVFKPKTNTILQNKKENFKTDSEKHYHRPMSKPAVEKQTLLKEKKKAKAVH